MSPDRGKADPRISPLAESPLCLPVLLRALGTVKGTSIIATRGLGVGRLSLLGWRWWRSAHRDWHHWHVSRWHLELEARMKAMMVRVLRMGHLGVRCFGRRSGLRVGGLLVVLGLIFCIGGSLSLFGPMVGGVVRGIGGAGLRVLGRGGRDWCGENFRGRSGQLPASAPPPLSSDSPCWPGPMWKLGTVKCEQVTVSELLAPII